MIAVETNAAKIAEQSTLIANLSVTIAEQSSLIAEQVQDRLEALEAASKSNMETIAEQSALIANYNVTTAEQSSLIAEQMQEVSKELTAFRIANETNTAKISAQIVRIATLEQRKECCRSSLVPVWNQNWVYTDQTSYTVLSSAIVSIRGYLDIERTSIKSIDSAQFPNLLTVDGYLEIRFNNALESILSFTELQSVGSPRLDIAHNPKLETINGFSNLETVKGAFSIYDNKALITVSPFFNLTSVSGAFFVAGAQSHVLSNPLMIWDADYHFPKLTCIGSWYIHSSSSISPTDEDLMQQFGRRIEFRVAGNGNC